MDMRNILANVPGLIAALTEAGVRARLCSGGRVEKDAGDDSLSGDETYAPTHLELILSASELAMLPFELAESPPGCPGAGTPLLLQSQVPICLTRRVRHNHRQDVSWRSKPRILFAAAAPGTEIPLQEHVDALVEVIQPWIDRARFDEKDPEAVYSDHLTVLTEATWEKIESTIASPLDEQPPRPYTHIHILAHVVETRAAGTSQFGIQLHHPSDPSQPQNVTAQQLALALRPAGKQGTAGFSCPTVVTLASCNSDTQKSVIGAGGSVAHTLNESGIPLVIASQFRQRNQLPEFTAFGPAY